MTDSYLQARAPHKAMAAHVAEHGTPEAIALYETAREYNATYFAGQLSDFFVEIANPGSPNAYASHMPRSPEGLASVMRIAPYVVAAGMKFAYDCLLHEMIHMWQTETDNREPGYQGHGPKFAAKCNEFGALLGLPEVSCRGKDGKPDCAQWPLNVRPEGYYGDSVKAAKAVAKATRPRQARKPRTVACQLPEPSKVEQALSLIAAMSDTERGEIRSALQIAPAPYSWPRSVH